MNLINTIAIFCCTFLISINSIKLHKNRQADSDISPLEHGEIIRLERNTNYTINIPKEWQYEYDENYTSISISPTNTTSPFTFSEINIDPLEADEKKMDIKELLKKKANELIESIPYPVSANPVVPPEKMTINKMEGGRFIESAILFDLPFEGYLGIVRDTENDNLIQLVAVYLQNQSGNFRPGLDKILNSIKKN